MIGNTLIVFWQFYFIYFDIYIIKNKIFMDGMSPNELYPLATFNASYFIKFYFV